MIKGDNIFFNYFHQKNGTIIHNRLTMNFISFTMDCIQDWCELHKSTSIYPKQKQEIRSTYTKAEDWDKSMGQKEIATCIVIVSQQFNMNVSDG